MDTTKLNQIEKNLLVFLDPTGNNAMEDWQFVRAEDVGLKYFFKSGKDSRDEKILYSFPRRQLWKYFIFLLIMLLHRIYGRVRSFLYVNDGILSSLFEVKNAMGYRYFAKSHLPKSKNTWKKITRLAPLMLRAEQIFIMKGFKCSKYSLDVFESNAIRKMDFMFFSNAHGKLLLTCSENIRSGCGEILKTTANPDFAKVMEKEYDRITEISSLLGKNTIVPTVGYRFSINGRYYYLENYIQGQSLLKVLRDLRKKRDVGRFIEQIEQLDKWFKGYISIFKGENKPISKIYEPTLNIFSSIYYMNVNTDLIINRVSNVLVEIDSYHQGFSCVVSHNDLWPGNFICHAEGLTAVDWERATVNRAPLFDYYWMMISAAVEFLLSSVSTKNYSLAFREFFMNNHVSSMYVHNKLKIFLRSIGISEEYHKDILLLFLMELSTQGYTAIGTQTDMDKVIFEELIRYSNVCDTYHY